MLLRMLMLKDLIKWNDTNGWIYTCLELLSKPNIWRSSDFGVIKMNQIFGFVLLVSMAVILLIFEVVFILQVTIFLVYLILVGYYLFHRTVTRGLGKA